MRASQYNLVVHDSGSALLVNLLSRAAVRLSPDAHAQYQWWAQGRIPDDAELDLEEREFAAFLKTNLFLVSDDLDELELLKARSHNARFKSRELGLVIAPTFGCNFSCHYCFETKSDRLLSVDSQQRIVELVESRVEGIESLAVQWFGGEPLRAMNVIDPLSRKLLDLARRHGLSYAATAITNGYLMTAEVAQRLCELGVTNVQVTLDGDRSLHDRTRREDAGGTSFDRILANLESAPETLAISLRIHLAPFNFQSVLDLLDTLDARGMQRHIDSLYVAPLFNYRAGMKTRPYATDGRRFATSQEFSNLQIPVLQKAQRLGFRLTDFLEASFGICTAVRADTLVVDAEGRLSKCYKDCGVDAESLGTLERGTTQPDNLSKWLSVEVPRDEECRSCKFLPLCLGGCTKQWQEGADKAVICTPLRYNHEDRIRLYFSE